MAATGWKPGRWKTCCSTCLEEKDQEHFYIHSNGKPRKQCKECLKANHHPDLEKKRIYNKKWQSGNREKCNLVCRNWRRNNLEYDCYRSNLYKTRKLNQTPLWADLEAIKQIYLNCPEGFHVDHIVPLKGKTVAGLHVHNNLQYLPAKENMAKRNIYHGE